MITIVLITVLLVLVVILAVLLFRATRRLLQFDETFQLFSNDIDINIRYFESLLKTNLFENSEEIKAATNNMKIIDKRLREFRVRFQEVRDGTQIVYDEDEALHEVVSQARREVDSLIPPVALDQEKNG